MSNHDGSRWRCKVCGFCQDHPPWGADGNTPSFGICDCCGVEFGYEDSTPAAAGAYRRSWLARGAPWLCEATRPPEWNLEQQLAAIGATSYLEPLRSAT